MVVLSVGDDVLNYFIHHAVAKTGLVHLEGIGFARWAWLSGCLQLLACLILGDSSSSPCRQRWQLGQLCTSLGSAATT
jgi:hypothetical protein